MMEVLWHGRGGQGAFTAARLLGAAATLSGEKFALAFPSFGPERRGAPMRAFTKISPVPIGDRSAVSHAGFVIYLDGTLLDENWADELAPGGLCLVNTKSAFDDPRLVAIDADGIASELLGRPIPNTVFLGALSVACDLVSTEDVAEANRQYMPAKLHGRNIAVVERAAELMRGLLAARTSTDEEGTEACRPSAAAPAPAKESPDTARENAAAPSAAHARSAHSPAAHICTLRDEVPQVSDFANTTCYEAGYLTQINAGWRNVRPVIDEASCTGCMQCYLACPDGVIFKVPAQGKTGEAVAVDLDFCKGCGVCAAVCRFSSIEMIPEAKAKEVLA